MRNFNILSLLLLATLWAGLLLGVSFLATPVKFLAPSLSLPVALALLGIIVWRICHLINRSLIIK